MTRTRMRLQRIRKSLENNLQHLEYKREYLSGIQPGYLYSDLNNLKSAIERIKNLGLYASLISEIETAIIY
jgi:hypothetical protein